MNLQMPLEAALFPHLFPDGEGYMDGSMQLHWYCQMRMRQAFSAFTLYKPYLLLMYGLLCMHRCVTAMKQMRVKDEIIRQRTRDPSIDSVRLTRRLLKDTIPVTLKYSPQWWGRQHADLKAVVRRRGLPSFFLTLTADEFSATRFPEMEAMDSLLQDLDLGSVCPLFPAGLAMCRLCV